MSVCKRCDRDMSDHDHDGSRWVCPERLTARDQAKSHIADLRRLLRPEGDS